MRRMITVSIEQLQAFAHRFWQQVGEAKTFLFYGEMGAGKTTVIEALCAAKGVTERMGSPTFSIINQSQTAGGPLIYHMDWYRLRDEEEAIQAGVEDALYGDGICFIEWPQKAPQLFDDAAVKIFIEAVSETERRISLVLPGRSITEQS